MHRVEELSDREEGFNSDKFIPFKNLIPLIEIIAEAKGAGVATKIVQTEYDELIKKFGSEMDILLKVNEENLKEQAPSRIVTGILRVRNNKVKIYPGYDGEYGKIEIFSSTDEGQEKQLTFF
jgi:PHP family Zn ribbon phosphoesterase